MRIELPVRSTQVSFSMWQCAIALLCCAFSIEPLCAQTLTTGNDDIFSLNPTTGAKIWHAYARALAANVVSLKVPADIPYGDRRAIVKDPRGIPGRLQHTCTTREANKPW
jgi:hypothetical protein